MCVQLHVKVGAHINTTHADFIENGCTLA